MVVNLLEWRFLANKALFYLSPKIFAVVFFLTYIGCQYLNGKFHAKQIQISAFCCKIRSENTVSTFPSWPVQGCLFRSPHLLFSPHLALFTCLCFLLSHVGIWVYNPPLFFFNLSFFSCKKYDVDYLSVYFSTVSYYAKNTTDKAIM